MAAESPRSGASGEGRGPGAWRSLYRSLGPGLITGAADDDPGGIATHSQAGAQFGLNMIWTIAFTFPLMVAIQLVSARIGLVTGRGLAANLSRSLPKPAVTGLVGLLLVANILNIGADIAAMGAAAQLMLGWGQAFFTVAFALVSLGLQLFIPYHRYVRFLKWLTLALFAYVGVVFTVQIDWLEVLAHAVTPQVAPTSASLIMVVAIFGTTISPYLMFWQTSEEVEDLQARREAALNRSPLRRARLELARIRIDTVIGMAFSALVSFFIMLTTAVTLHDAGVTDITTSAQAAEALRPIAGPLAFSLFSLGIIGTGLLAVPVLAGSAAYAVAETFGWREGLERQPWEAKGFYGVIAAAMAVALGVVFSSLDPIRALFWSAVVNGVISVPVMGAMMWVATRSRDMGRHRSTGFEATMGWAATAIMGAAVVAMFVLGAS